MLVGEAMKHEVPLQVRLALRVLLNHIEDPPSWHNCKATVSSWLEQVAIDETEKAKDEGTFLGSLAEHPAPDEYHRSTQRPYGGDCGIRTSELLKGHKPKE